MCKYKDTTLGIKKLDFNVKRGAIIVSPYASDRTHILTCTE